MVALVFSMGFFAGGLAMNMTNGITTELNPSSLYRGLGGDPCSSCLYLLETVQQNIAGMANVVSVSTVKRGIDDCRNKWDKNYNKECKDWCKQWTSWKKELKHDNPISNCASHKYYH